MTPQSSEVRGDVVSRFALSAASARVVRYRPRCHMPEHTHDWSSITLLLAGSMIDSIAGGTHHCGPLTLITKPAGAPHETRVGPEGALTLNFRLDPKACGEMPGDPSGACRFFASGRATAHLLGLPLGGGVACREGASPALSGLLAACAASGPPTSPLSGGGGTPPTTQEAARAARMHPVAYARWFRRQTGWSPCRWRIQARLARAAEALARTGDSIASVAFDAGFADQAHLGRLFKREIGLTPSQFRACVQALSRA